MDTYVVSYLQSCFQMLSLTAMRIELNEEWEELSSEINVSLHFLK